MARTTTQERVKRLQAHLDQENPVLAGAVRSFLELDQLARKLGFLDEAGSYTAQVSWWPVISVLGTFSAGKSTFINEYVGQKLQRTGNQAVDDKFTVICYGADEQSTVLPGLALDSDPRFPLYQISRDIEQVAAGEGRRVDSYLQLKTCRSDALRGKIIIDSPGFDADQQRTSTLLITDQIIDLSDLVLVFFDARHPEPGAMADTLQHLVSETVKRPDATKFLYILNQIDNTFREDNPEEVVAAWQRALAQHGLTAGRFYRIYSRDSALPIDNEDVRKRLERKRDEDLADIQTRIRQVEVERAYRVVGTLEKTARRLRDTLVPAVNAARSRWRRRSLMLGGAVFGLIAAAFAVTTLSAGYWNGLRFEPLAGLDPYSLVAIGGLTLVVAVYLGLTLQRFAGRTVLAGLKRHADNAEDRQIARAFEHNLTSRWHSLSSPNPKGWNRRTARRLDGVLGDADGYVQQLNDRYANPSGSGESTGED